MQRLSTSVLFAAVSLGAAAAAGTTGSAPFQGSPLPPALCRLDPRLAPQEPAAPTEDGEGERQALLRQTDFALALHRELAAVDPAANVFASPLSVWTALAMLAEGAEGRTAEELARALHGGQGAPRLDELRELARALRARLDAAADEVEIAWADALWVERSFPLDEQLAARLEQAYAAALERLDFAGAPEEARQRINAWVAERTRERIEELLPAGSIDASTRLVLTDAVYFRGRWAETFDAERTADLPFHGPGGESFELPFLRDEERVAPVAFLDAEDRPRPPGEGGAGGMTVLELPYEGGALAFVALLPDADRELSELERELDAERLGAILARLRETRVRVELPALEMRPSYDLVPALRALGIEAVFEQAKADLTGFVAGERAVPLHVSAAVHEAFLRLDEEGTEAAAATGIVTVTRDAGPPPLLRLDRPFLFAIRERASGALLFLGRITDPRG